MIKLILPIVLLFSQCVSSLEKKDNICEKNIQRSSDLCTEYYMDNNSIHLDSALFYIDEVLGSCEEYDGFMQLRKLSILSMKQDYSNALLFIETFEENLYGNMPYFQNLLKNRFNAMKSQSEGDTVLRDYYLNFIIKELEEYISLNKEKVDSLLKLSNANKILESPLSSAVIQYYYYRSINEGIENVENELVSTQKSIGGNNEFFDIIMSSFQEDFMVFIGF